MDKLRRSIAAFLLAGFAAAPAAAADPFITLTRPADEPNLAWWLLDASSRPEGNMVAGVTLAQINAALGEGEPRWCAAQALTPASFTSADPAVRAEVGQYLDGPDGNMFSATTRMTGVPVFALAGNFRACGEGGIGPFVLLVQQDAAGARVVHARGFFGWTPFIALRAEGARLIVSPCLECDHAEILSFSRRTGSFHWRGERSPTEH